VNKKSEVNDVYVYVFIYVYRCVCVCVCVYLYIHILHVESSLCLHQRSTQIIEQIRAQGRESAGVIQIDVSVCGNS
jgi:hypothetical protein